MKSEQSTYPLAATVSVSRIEVSKLPDYLLLTKPRLVSLVLLTTVIGFIVASGPTVSFWGILHILLGTALVAAGGASLNQFLERDTDARMERTASRPLAAARISPRGAAFFGVLLIAGGLVYLYHLCNPLTALLGLVSAALYVLVYTPLKRRTPWCVAFGAIVGALPPIMGWTAASGALAWGAAAFFVIMFVWQLSHFLAIVVIYREQYANARSAIVRLADADGRRAAQHILWLNLLLIPLTLLPSILGLAGTGYTVAAVILGITFAAVAVRSSNTIMKSYARRIFYASLVYLPVLFIIMAIFRRGI